MPELMDQATRDKLVELLAVLQQPVNLVLFADDSEASKIQVDEDWG